MATTNKTKTEKVDIEIAQEDIDELAKSEPVKLDINNAVEAISSLIVALCEEAKARRMRDEYKTYEAIAALMTSLK